MTNLELSPALAVTIFVAACICGVQFRRVWKTEGPRWQLWLWGVLAASGLLTVGFVPLRLG